MLLLVLGLHDYQAIQHCHDPQHTAPPCANHRLRFWPKADMPKNAIDVAIGGKADMAYCSANLRYDPKRTCAGLAHAFS